VIDYETFAKIHDCRDRQGLTVAQTARAALGLDPKTVAAWGDRLHVQDRPFAPAFVTVRHIRAELLVQDARRAAEQRTGKPLQRAVTRRVASSAVR
jgi:hypothetical protein